MLEWLQSFEGIMQLSFGGISIAAIITFTTTSIMNLRKAGSLKEAVASLVETKKQAEIMFKKNEELIEKNEILEQKNNQLIEDKNRDSIIQEKTLKTLAIIVAASGGIDSVSKISLLEDLKKVPEKIYTEVKTAVKPIADKAVSQAKEIKTEVVEEVKETILEGSLKLIEDTIDKYSKK